MQSQLSCPLCNFEYCEQKTPRILSMCGHTFCETCIETMILPQGEDKFKLICPQDETAQAYELQNNNLKQFPVNKALMKIIESNKSKSSFKDSSFDVSKIVKQQELQEDEETKQLISAIQQSQQQESSITQKQESSEANGNSNTQFNDNKANTTSKKQQSSKKVESDESEEDENVCLLHQKPLEIVCVVDLEKICAKCAIFGKHKGHQFKSIEQIEQQNNSFYQDLLAVYDEKTEIMIRVEKKETKSDLVSILNTNKDSLIKQVKQRFKKLIDTIKAEEKKALTKLQKMTQKIEKDIDDLYSIDSSLIQKYEEWERLSFEKLQIIEKGTFQEKLRLLLIDQSKKEKNIIIQGKSLVDKIKAQEDSIFNKAEVMLTNIHMKTSDKIFDFTESFVQIFDKPQQAQKVQTIQFDQPTKNAKQNLIFDSGKKHSQDDLLEVEDNGQDPIEQHHVQFSSTFPKSAQKGETQKIEECKFIPILQNKFIEEKPIARQECRRNTENIQNEKKVQMPLFQENVQNTTKEDSFALDKVVRPTKKKLKSIKIPQKYEKALQSLYADNSQTFDLTNAQLGDNIILQICEFIPGTKVKTIKFIRNKLTDDCVAKILPYVSNVITLNLSQNLLTERVLDVFIENRDLLPKVKNIILSLNKIIERKHKGKIDELRKLDITVSV